MLSVDSLSKGNNSAIISLRNYQYLLSSFRNKIADDSHILLTCILNRNKSLFFLWCYSMLWLIPISMHYSVRGGRWRWGMLYIVLRCYWGARGPQPPCNLSLLSLYLFVSCMACLELAWWQMFLHNCIHFKAVYF